MGLNSPRLKEWVTQCNGRIFLGRKRETLEVYGPWVGELVLGKIYAPAALTKGAAIFNNPLYNKALAQLCVHGIGKKGHSTGLAQVNAHNIKTCNECQKGDFITLGYYLPFGAVYLFLPPGFGIDAEGHVVDKNDIDLKYTELLIMRSSFPPAEDTFVAFMACIFRNGKGQIRLPVYARLFAPSL
ncbi:hypothetical protein BU26DRAFT_568712 [Trematosphaeria pertusa]|uniref:Uncharacterized protein n=1 Tax=Trematosphaeria pertusa TaxID=390896 RepID=A0A6A6I360_9PLEO|nr:uncharacterized protein BU26DRAFT_568712 [Trematosphaeria pertusa]KAF2244706.1 hypothetical protein BU26DRAFT_568712 [Trematosphaeria pertusa]